LAEYSHKSETVPTFHPSGKFTIGTGGEGLTAAAKIRCKRFYKKLTSRCGKPQKIKIQVLFSFNKFIFILKLALSMKLLSLPPNLINKKCL
jgi:hypothetical protein